MIIKKASKEMGSLYATQGWGNRSIKALALLKREKEFNRKTCTIHSWTLRSIAPKALQDATEPRSSPGLDQSEMTYSSNDIDFQIKKALTYGNDTRNETQYSTLQCDNDTTTAGAECSRRMLLMLFWSSLSFLSTQSAAFAFNDFTFIPQRSLLLAPFPPKAVQVPRRRLGLQFAVLLLRSGYEVADDVDYIPMDSFQKNFFLTRQSQWQPYMLLQSSQTALDGTIINNNNIFVKQGDLTDPMYFDFICAMQLETIFDTMQNAQKIFTEYCEECPDQKRVVQRPAELKDDAVLPTEWQRRYGDRVLDSLVNGFQGVDFLRGPSMAALIASPPTVDCETEDSFDGLRAGVQTLLDVFVQQGYALRAEIMSYEVTKGVLKMVVKLEGLSTLWSFQYIANRSLAYATLDGAQQQRVLFPVYDAYVVAAYLRKTTRQDRRMKIQCEFAWTETTVTENWTVDFFCGDDGSFSS